ncbi:MAG: SDR family NAD(P)-dependent oxidoreductase, partial [Fulvivirga sp.]|nr:SDR family NAD(P)-dependent oxidoreductase [Fulvivirga sp.]
LSLLTRLLVDDLIANRPSYILNVGSLAGFCYIPYKSLYTATKSFVNTFTLSLKEELVDHGICVSALCPGPVATNDDCRSRTEKHGLIAKMSQTESAYVANKAINGMLAGKSIIIPGALNRFLFLLNYIIPKRLKFTMIKKEFLKELS